MERQRRNHDEYSTSTGLIFVFNLIVGTGALTLPAVFANAGWILGLLVIAFLAFISYMTVTFVIETMACANAVVYWRRLQFLKREVVNHDANDYDDDRRGEDERLLPAESSGSLEQTPLFTHQQSRYYNLDNKIELGDMAGLFFNDFGRMLFYFCITIYLYGDLSIYTAAVAKSVRDIICQHNSTATLSAVISSTEVGLNDEFCWDEYPFTRSTVYRMCLVGFVSIFGPFALFNVTKTKYIQMITILCRWAAFLIMIGLAITRLVTINDPAELGHPKAFNFAGLPSLFGACVYSFMCHHSLPSLIAPIANKQKIKFLMSMDYLLICLFYIFLAVTGAFAFAHIEDLYTLNFIPQASDSSTGKIMEVVDYFLALFPVFTLSASFPVIAITLRNNLQTLFLDMSRIDSYNFFLRRLLFPLLAVIPPLLVTYFTESLTSLVGFTGSYAGTGIQYLIPIFLVFFARRTCKDLLGQGIINKYRSPFASNWWLVGVLVWSIGCVALVTVNFLTNLK